MRSFLLLTVVCLIYISGLFGQSYKVLFIGNSYTEVNNLPQMVADVAASNHDTISFQSYTPGGCTFQQHVSGAASYIQTGGWDYVVLQEQSQLPSFPIGQFMNESYPYAQQLCEMIRQYNPEAHIVFYMTWGRKNGDQQNAVYYPPLGTYEGMDSLLYARYMMMAQDNHAWVSPVGYVWHCIRDQYPSIELYAADESHPSLAGTYAAACSFYTVFFQKDPTQITYETSLDHATTQIIRDIVKENVFDSLARWFVVTDTVPVTDSTAVTTHTEPDIQIRYNISNGQLEVSTDQDLPYQITLYSLQGQSLWQTKQSGQEAYVSLPVGLKSTGVYLVRYQDRNGSVTRKIFIPSL